MKTTFVATQEEAATAYDMAAIEYRGLNAVTNFDLSRYINCLRPNGTHTPAISNADATPDDDDIHSPFPNDAVADVDHQHHNQLTPSGIISGGGSSPPSSSALGLLLQSSKFKEMLERSSRSTTANTDSQPSTPAQEISESDHQLPRRSFPEDIQTYFDCQDSATYAGEEILFGDLNSFASPIFHCELDG